MRLSCRRAGQVRRGGQAGEAAIDAEHGFSDDRHEPTRQRLWRVVAIAILLCVLGIVLGGLEWRRQADAAQAARALAARQQADRVATRLQDDVLGVQLLLRALQLGIRAGDGQQQFAIAVERLRPDLLAARVRMMAQLSAQGAALAVVWLDEGARLPAGTLDAVLAQVGRRTGNWQGLSVGYLLSPFVDDATHGLLVLPVVAADGGVSVALVALSDWLPDRLAELAPAGFHVRVSHAEGVEPYRTADWPLAGQAQTPVVAHLVSPPWRVELLPRGDGAAMHGGLVAALSYVLGGALLAALVLGLGGQRDWLARRVAAITHELDAGNARLQRALIVSREGALEYVLESRRLFCSDRLRAMLGLSMDPPTLSQLLRQVSARDRRALVRAVRSLGQGLRALDETVRLRETLGADRWLRIRALTQLDDDGTMLRVTASVSDISGEMAQRRQLERYRDFLDALMEALPVPLSVKNADLHWTFVNQAYCRSEQRAREDFIGHRTQRIVDEETARRLEAMDRAALDSGQPQVANLWLRRPDGHNDYVRVTKVRCEGPDGRPVILTSTEDLTQLREEQERQAALHGFYQDVFDALPHPVFIKDRAHRYVMTNRAHAESRGCTKDDIVGATSYDHAEPAVARQIELAEDQLFAGTAPPLLENEYPLIDPAGRVRSTLVRKVALQGLDGEPLLVGINTDISALREMEASLRAALHRFAILFEQAPLGMALIGDDGRLLDANPSLLRTLDYTREELLALHHADISPPEEHALDQAQARQMLAQGYCAPFAKHYLRKDGWPVPVLVSGIVVREGERVSQIWGLVQDTSERDAALAALRESEARWQFALEGAGDGVWDWDAARDSVFYSSRWKGMLGYAEDEIGHGMEEWQGRLHPDDATDCLATLEAHIQGRSPLYIHEHRLRCRDGHYLWLLARGKVVARDEHGRVLRLIVTQTDISGRRAAEDELRHHRDRLAELVREQTDDVVRAKEAAERALEAKSVFLANMSHELRTPMHAVLSFAQLGEARAQQVPVEKLRDYFQRIDFAGKRLMHLLDDLLDLSKLEAGRMNMDLRSVSVGRVAEEVAHEYEAWLQAKQVRLQLNIPRDLPLAWADQARLGQVLRNLLSNAIKFTAAGSPILLSATPCMLARGRRASDERDVAGIEIVVGDNGPGIPPQELEAVFEKFVQSTATRTGAGGTGLGLAICREIVMAHRGRIFARNRPGGGAEFVVQLPAAPAQDGPVESLESET